MNKEEIGKQLKYYRMEAGLTQAQLAEKINIHEKQISRIESGIHFPTFNNFIKILDVLNIEFKDFNCSSTKKYNPLKEKLHRLINSSSEKDLKLYISIIENIQKYKKNN